MKIGAFQVGESNKFENGADSAFILDEPKIAVLDTFSPTIKVPSSSANQIFALIFHGLTYSVSNELLLGPCDRSLYHAIHLHNGKTFFKLNPETYVLDIGEGDKCFLAIDYNTEDEWVLGEPFFRSFVSIFDDEKGLIAFAPSVNYPNAQIYDGEAPKVVIRHRAEED